MQIQSQTIVKSYENASSTSYRGATSKNLTIARVYCAQFADFYRVPVK